MYPGAAPVPQTSKSVNHSMPRRSSACWTSVTRDGGMIASIFFKRPPRHVWSIALWHRTAAGRQPVGSHVITRGLHLDGDIPDRMQGALGMENTGGLLAVSPR